MTADMKAALGNNSKPDLTHVRRPLMAYVARACAYGSDKYERSNFMRPAPQPKYERQRSEPLAADFLRLREYTRAAVSHLMAMLDAMELHEANDPNLVDVDGMKSAAYAADTDETPGAKVGASMLPHIAHACASLNMAITQATTYGLLPEDPGTPWREPAIHMKCTFPQLFDRHGRNVTTANAGTATSAAAAEADGWITQHPRPAHTVVGTATSADRPLPVVVPDPHAELRAQIAAAGLPPAPDEALVGRKLVRGRSGGWRPSGSVRACFMFHVVSWRTADSDGSPYVGNAPDGFYLVPVEWI